MTAAKQRGKRERLKGDLPPAIIIMVVHKIRGVVVIRDLIKLEEGVINSSKEVAEAVIMLLRSLSTPLVFP